MILCGSRPKGRGSASKWYQSHFLAIYCRQKEAEKENKNTLIHIKVVSEKDFVCLFQMKRIEEIVVGCNNK
jgi:hypothetical protein